MTELTGDTAPLLFTAVTAITTTAAPAANGRPRLARGGAADQWEVRGALGGGAAAEGGGFGVESGRGHAREAGPVGKGAWPERVAAWDARPVLVALVCHLQGRGILPTPDSHGHIQSQESKAETLEVGFLLVEFLFFKAPVSGLLRFPAENSLFLY